MDDYPIIIGTSNNLCAVVMFTAPYIGFEKYAGQENFME